MTDITDNPKQEHIYELKLHDYISFEGMVITRVPGGWVYASSFEDINGKISTSCCFVPYHNEFKL